MHQANREPGVRHGVLVIDKPTGLTSHDVVACVRRATGLRRIGHTGTLDPIATGVLPLVLGRATRLAPFLSATAKTYEAVFRLGMVTDTYDVTGNVVESPRPREGRGGEPVWLASVSPGDEPPGVRDTPALVVDQRINWEALEAARAGFLGTFWQRPPRFSAKKIGGVRAYRLARHQKPAEPEPVEVTVHEFEILAFEGKRLRCRLTCSPGFYVRALAHELGIRLGCGACVEALRRERSAGFGLDAAVPLDVVAAEGAAALNRLTPLPDLLLHLPAFELTDRGAERAVHGNTVLPGDVTAMPTPSGAVRPGFASAIKPGRVRLLGRRGELIAIAETAPGGLLHPTIVLV